MQLRELLTEAAARLDRAGVESSGREAELLLQHCLNVSRSGLFLRLDTEADSDLTAVFYPLLSRRCNREPLQYITGSCEFWSLEFEVNPHVLIPRPETEFLLEQAVAAFADQRNDTLRLLDLCTGSGVIATVLAREFTAARVTATDLSPQALVVAGRNVVQHRVAGQVSLLCADLFTALCDRPVFDGIVTNPPYVMAGDIPDLEPEVRDWEPFTALSGGTGGMDCIDAIRQQAAGRLKPGGLLYMEIGADLAKPVLESFETDSRYTQVEVLPDLAGLPRVLQARRVSP